MRERRSELYQRALVADALDAGDSAFGKLAAPLPLAGDVPCLEAACIAVERGLTCRNEKSTISISPATSVQATAADLVLAPGATRARVIAAGLIGFEGH